jgi:hypothetical protein
MPYYSKARKSWTVGPGLERNDTMSWDEIFKSLVAELGREPDSGEVQERMLEIVREPAIRQRTAPSHPRIVPSGVIPLKQGA